MPSDLHAPHHAARELLEYAERLTSGERGDSGLQDALARVVSDVREDPDKYIDEWVADPSGLLAQVYRLCAQSTGDEAELGRLILRTAFLPQLRAVARLKAERISTSDS